jgi:adenylate cyclase
MGVEIERKFLVRNLSAIRGHDGVAIRQGYLSVEPERTIRVRWAGNRGFLTIKGADASTAAVPAATVSPPAVRPEYEYEIPAQDADALLDEIALRPLIEKTRYRVDEGGLVWEVDVFAGENEGLVVAEVELASEYVELAVPEWVGAEVTADPRYLNASLVAHPYRTWRS